jgi:hypothetical protein
MSAAAGWYPATDGSGQSRYWDGERWAEPVIPAPPSAPPPANWYPAQDRPGHERYWDGAAWTTAYRPGAQVASSTTGGAGGVDNSPAWLLVAMPFLILGVTIALLSGGVAVDGSAATLVGALAIGAVATWDSRMLRARGYQVSGALAFFLVPFYLIQRTKVTRQTYVLPVVWVVVFVGYLMAAQSASNHYGPFQLDMPRLEQSIKQQVDLAASTSSSVSCPSDSTYVLGATFDCTASDGTGQLTERVTVHAKAFVTWQPVGGSTP